VEPWYRQNILLFVRADCLSAYPHLPKAAFELPLEIVHPKAYQNSLGYYTEPLKSELAQVRAELAQTQQLLRATQGELAAMQTSKFWRLRTHWLQLKQKMRKWV